jgi:UrcA family protein
MVGAHSLFAAVVTFGVLGFGAHRPPPAQAVWTDGDTVMVSVRYGDLDLSSPRGVEAMLRRIRQAAARVCGPEPADRLSFQRQYDACVSQTVARALQDLARSVAARDDAGSAILTDARPR